MRILTLDFFEQNACTVAEKLLGAILVRQTGKARISGKIVEVEAYTGREDAASHSHRGKTGRNAPMWEKPGRAYVYLIYGMYHLLNVVCEPEGQPAAVLIRALEPLEGIDTMQTNRNGQKKRTLTSGPGRLTMALGVNLTHNRSQLTDKNSGLWIESGNPIARDKICTGARVGMGKEVPDPWRSKPWRWWINDNAFVSKWR